MDDLLREFIAENTGKFIGVNAIDTGECTGLVMKWFEKIGAKFEYGNAKDLLTNADHNFFDVVYNTADNVPVGGDSLVWGTQVGENGHTAVFIDGDANTFRSFDQKLTMLAWS